jgi:hypothetical protein
VGGLDPAEGIGGGGFGLFGLCRGAGGGVRLAGIVVAAVVGGKASRGLAGATGGEQGATGFDHGRAPKRKASPVWRGLSGSCGRGGRTSSPLFSEYQVELEIVPNFLAWFGGEVAWNQGTLLRWGGWGLDRFLGQLRSGQLRSGQLRSGQLRSGQLKAGQRWPVR